MHKLLKLLFVTLLASSAFLTGCGSTVPVVKPFKMDIQQGNVVTSKMLLQLKPGMTKSQVKFIMGTPLIVDSFHSNRWDYFYQMRQAGKIKEQRRVILDFDNELLARVRGDVVPEGTAGAASSTEAGAVTLPKSVEPKAKEEGLLDKLKFWKKDEQKTEVKPAAKPELKESAREVKLPEAKTEPKVEIPANDALEGNNDAAAGDTPSILAVPIELGSPVEPAPSAVVPAVQAPKVELPAVETPKTEPAPIAEPVKIAPAKTAPVTPAPAPIKAVPEKSAPVLPIVPPPPQDESFIFRIDKNLDLKNTEATPADVAPVAQPKKVDVPPPPPEEEPGYFEKMLEKIGF